jgi:hypothetical protein
MPVLDLVQTRLVGRTAGDGLGNQVWKVGLGGEDDLLLGGEIVEQAAARDAGGLGDVVQRRDLEPAPQEELHGLDLDTGVGLRALALAQADGKGRLLALHSLHICTQCMIWQPKPFR